MEQTVYGDLLFFVNFCMDFQCLFLTAKLLRRPFCVWRGLLFSALGALYACAALFLSTSGAFAFLADCGVCFLMCWGTFCGKRIKMRQILAPFGLYFAVSLAMGGVMSGMASLLSHLHTPIGGGEDLSTGAFFLLALAGGLSTLFWGRLCRRRAHGKRTTLTLVMGGREARFCCMVDTGNLLRDPIGGRPVVLLDTRAAGEILEPRLLQLAEQKDLLALSELPHELSCRIRVIPAGTAVGRGLLFAVAPDEAWLDAGGGELPLEILVAPTRLFVDTDDYEALLPAELIA